MKREVFGAPECPLLYRWKLLDLGDSRGKLMLHWFLPNRREHDFHDHPRSFLTFVLFGTYTDICIDGTEDVVKAPTIRYRRYSHAHVTVAGPYGCLTLAAFGPRRRAWGFYRDGNWFGWEAYERIFGSRFRCE